MSTAPDTDRLAALLAEHEYAATLRSGAICVCGFVPTVDPQSLQSQQDYHRAHLVAVLTAAGVGSVAEAERERDWARATNDRLNRRVQIAEAAVHELTTGTGHGKARPVAAEMWARCQETHERHCPRAERAEAALERVRALADAWDRDAAAACDGADHSGCPDCDGTVYAADLRALLDTEPTP